MPRLTVEANRKLRIVGEHGPSSDEDRITLRPQLMSPLASRLPRQPAWTHDTARRAHRSQSSVERHRRFQNQLWPATVQPAQIAAIFVTALRLADSEEDLDAGLAKTVCPTPR